MNRIWLAPLVLVPLLFAAAATACSSDPPAVQDAGATTDTGPQPDTGVSTLDSGSDGSITCTFAAPNFNGPALCGAQPLGAVITAQLVDGGVPDGGFFRGGFIEPGIYDAVLYETSTGNPAFKWTETIVFGPNNTYTRSRQIATGPTPNLPAYSSGTYATTGTALRFNEPCFYRGDAGTEAGDGGTNSGNYTAFKVGCDTFFQYGAGSITTFKRRN